jgi:CheY-like chemotaxis protein
MKSIKILLIEDDLYLREMYELVLQKSGFTVIIAADGEKGLQLTKDNPDILVVLTDVMLPKMSGLDVLKAVKSDNATKNIPVVMMSNFTDEGIIKKALKDGAQSYLFKAQLSPEQLVEKVKEFMK